MAEQICKQVLAFAPECSDVWALLTETALRRNRVDAAIVCADRAAALNPRDPTVHILRAKCRFFSGDTGEAVAAAEQASRNSTSAPEVLDSLGAIFGLLGQHRRALEPSRRAVAARPRYRNIYSISPPPSACWGSSKPPNCTAMTRSR